MYTSTMVLTTSLRRQPPGTSKRQGESAEELLVTRGVGHDWEVTTDVESGTAILANSDLVVTKVTCGDLYSASHLEMCGVTRNLCRQASANDA